MKVVDRVCAVAISAGVTGDFTMPRMPNATDVHVGARIRARRMMINMRQEALASQIGVSFQQVQKYEKGTNRVGASRLQSIAHVLGVQPAHFFEGLGAASGGAEAVDVASDLRKFLTSRDGVELNRAFLRIRDAKLRKKVLALIRTVAGEATDTRENEPVVNR
jgi:Predicted transcriptional regulators